MKTGQNTPPPPTPEYTYVEYLNVLKSSRSITYNNVGSNAQDITDRIIGVWKTNDLCDDEGTMLVNMWVHFYAQIQSTMTITQTHDFEFITGENVKDSLIAWFYHEETSTITCQYWGSVFDQNDRYKVKWYISASAENDPPSYYYDLDIIGNPAPTVIMLTQEIAEKLYYKLSIFSTDTNIGITDNMKYEDYSDI